MSNKKNSQKIKAPFHLQPPPRPPRKQSTKLRFMKVCFARFRNFNEKTVYVKQPVRDLANIFMQ